MTTLTSSQDKSSAIPIVEFLNFWIQERFQTPFNILNNPVVYIVLKQPTLNPVVLWDATARHLLGPLLRRSSWNAAPSLVLAAAAAANGTLSQCQAHWRACSGLSRTAWIKTPQLTKVLRRFNQMLAVSMDLKFSLMNDFFYIILVIFHLNYHFLQYSCTVCHLNDMTAYVYIVILKDWYPSLWNSFL